MVSLMVTKEGVILSIKQVELSFAIRGELYGRHGIVFDTGIDHNGVAEWFLDYSLQYGNEIENREDAIVKIKEVLDKNSIQYESRAEEYED